MIQMVQILLNLIIPTTLIPKAFFQYKYVIYKPIAIIVLFPSFYESSSRIRVKK